MKIPAARLELINRIAAQARRQAGSRKPVDVTRFIRAYFRGVGEEDLATRRPEDLAGAALYHLEIGAKRRTAQPLVRVFNPDPSRDGFSSPHTVILMITEDMSFLVDSMAIAITRSGVAIHFLAHPILHVRRDRNGALREASDGSDRVEHTLSESWQLFEVDRITDSSRLKEVQERVLDMRPLTSWKSRRPRVATKNSPAAPTFICVGGSVSTGYASR